MPTTFNDLDLDSKSIVNEYLTFQEKLSFAKVSKDAYGLFKSHTQCADYYSAYRVTTSHFKTLYSSPYTKFTTQGMTHPKMNALYLVQYNLTSSQVKVWARQTDVAYQWNAPDVLSAIEFLSTDHLVVGNTQGKVSVLDIKSGKIISEQAVDSESIQTLNVQHNADGAVEKIYVGLNNGTIKCLEPATLQIIQTLNLTLPLTIWFREKITTDNPYHLKKIAVTEDNIIMLSEGGHYLHVFEQSTGAYLYSRTHNYYGTIDDFTVLSNKQIATSVEDIIAIVDIVSGKSYVLVVDERLDYQADYHLLKLLPDHKLLHTVGRFIQIWDLVTQRCILQEDIKVFTNSTCLEDNMFTIMQVQVKDDGAISCLTNNGLLVELVWSKQSLKQLEIERKQSITTQSNSSSCLLS